LARYDDDGPGYKNEQADVEKKIGRMTVLLKNRVDLFG
jgi:hypothetical protein